MNDLINKIIYVNEQVKQISTLLKSVASKVDGRNKGIITRFITKTVITNDILNTYDVIIDSYLRKKLNLKNRKVYFEED